MTPEERNELREKHSPKVNDAGKCMACGGTMNHPCDAIKVLDATEPPCEHRGPDGSYYGYSEPEDDMDYQYTYCPICGDKL